jgi:hypothetical protein
LVFEVSDQYPVINFPQVADPGYENIAFQTIKAAITVHILSIFSVEKVT